MSLSAIRENRILTKIFAFTFSEAVAECLTHRLHCVVSLSKNINPSIVLVQPRMTRPFITEKLLMGRIESNQTNKQIKRG